MVIGVDEVGRGCWAGPLVAAAVGLPDGHGLKTLNDSKKLSSKQRSFLTTEIVKLKVPIGIGWVWPKEVNKIGLTESVRLAMERALSKIGKLNYPIIVDGNINYLSHLPNTEAIVRADGSVPAVSAASVIAKTARDAYMIQLAVKYPEYGFEKHVGYGTKLHHEALKRHGVTIEHRLNYKPVRKLLEQQ